MNVAAYVRVSTDKQADDKHYSIPEQTERVTAFCKARGWNLIKVYTDPGFTGGNMNRPALQELIRDIEAYDIVLVNKLDRLSRSQKDILYLIQDVFAPHGCSFVSMQESFDTTTPIGIAMVGILAAFAQLERSQIKERTKMGKDARKKKGLWHGGYYMPIGYEYVNGKLVINDEAPQVQLIFDMFLKGTSIREITRYLNEHYTTRYTSWNYAGTVRKILSNPVYIGMIDEYKGQHEPIIDEDTFYQAQARLMDFKTGKKKSGTNHLLTGMIYCGECGARVRANSTVPKKGNKHTYYRCGRVDSSSLDKIKTKCTLKSKREDELDQYIINEILKLKAKDIKIKPKSEPKVDNTAEIKKIDIQINHLIDLYAICGDNIEQLAKKLKGLKAKKDTLEKANIRPNKPTEEQIMHTLSIAKETFENGSKNDQILIVNALIDRVTLYNDAIKIEWKF